MLVGYFALRRRGLLERFAERINPFVRHLRLVWQPLGIGLAVVTLGLWLLEALWYLLVADSLGISISLAEAVFINTFTAFCSLVPAAPGYLGTFDAALITDCALSTCQRTWRPASSCWSASSPSSRSRSPRWCF